MYALLGYMSERMSLMNADWNLVNKMLSDQHFDNKDAFLQVYRRKRNEIESNRQQKRSKEYINELVKNKDRDKENYEKENE